MNKMEGADIFFNVDSGQNKSLVVSGICSTQTCLNGVYAPMTLTASGSPWYKNGDGKTLYFDPDCDGSGANPYPQWIFNNKSLSVTATSDLDGRGICQFDGAISSTDGILPSGTNTWVISCDNA